MFNRDAGNAVPVERLRHELGRAGYDVVREVERGVDLREAVTEDVDLVVVAGGDGTVRRAAQAVVGSRTCLAVLPVGTANNIATSLGIDDDVEQVIRGWSMGRRLAFDLVTVRGAWGGSLCLEGVGTGLLPAGMQLYDSTARGEDSARRDADADLARSLEAYRDVLAQATPERATLVGDSWRMDGSFLLVEVLNIGSVGPNFALAPGADPTDGWLDVITAQEEQRSELMEYLRGRIAGRVRPLSLPVRRARRVEAHGWRELHVDDEIRAGSAAVSIGVAHGALEFLVPPSTHDATNDRRAPAR